MTDSDKKMILSPFKKSESTSSSPLSIRNKYSPLTPLNSSYIQNPNQQILKILEDYELHLHKKSFKALIDFLFSKDSLFVADARKTREYYQAILVDTGSIKVVHNHNSSNPSRIDFSKVQIFHILSIQEWKACPYTNKTLSNHSTMSSYNYYDYQDAWFNFLYLRSYTHSWFIFFDKNFDNHYPSWFVNWFKFMGNIPDTLHHMFMVVLPNSKRCLSKIFRNTNICFNSRYCLIFPGSFHGRSINSCNRNFSSTTSQNLQSQMVEKASQRTD